MSVSERKSQKHTNDAKEAKEAVSVNFDDENDDLFLLPGDATHGKGNLMELRYIEMVYIDVARYFSTRPNLCNVNDKAFLQMVLKSAAVNPPLGRVERFALNRHNKLGYETVMRVFGLRCLAFLHCSGDESAFERVPIYVTPASDGSIPVVFKHMNVYFITGTKCKCAVYNANQERTSNRPSGTANANVTAVASTAPSRIAMPLPPPQPPPPPAHPLSASSGMFSRSGEQKLSVLRSNATVKQHASMIERKNPQSLVDMCRNFKRPLNSLAGPATESRTQSKRSTSKVIVNKLRLDEL